MNKLTAKRSYEMIGVGVKSLLEDQAVFTAALLILVAITSFGLGRQSVAERAISEPVPKEFSVQNSPTASKSPQVTDKSEVGARYVASKNGQVYHLLICPGAKQINDANKIYFDTKEEAEAAGLRPAANCKGI